MERTFLGGPNKVKHLLKVLAEIELHTCVCGWHLNLDCFGLGLLAAVTLQVCDPPSKFVFDRPEIELIELVGGPFFFLLKMN